MVEVPDADLTPQPPGEGGLPTTPDILATIERSNMPDALKESLRSLYTVPGAEVIGRIKEAQLYGDVEGLVDAAKDAHAFMFDGLVYGKEAAAYDLDNENTLMMLQWRFETQEGLLARPESSQIKAALDEATAAHGIEVGNYLASVDAPKFGAPPIPEENLEGYWKNVLMTVRIRRGDEYTPELEEEVAQEAHDRAGENQPDSWRADKLKSIKRVWMDNLIRSTRREKKKIDYAAINKEAQIRAVESLADHEADLLPWVDESPTLQALKIHTEARREFDLAIRQRHFACPVDDKSLQQRERGLMEMDKEAWRSYYRFGEKEGEPLSGEGAAVSDGEKFIEDIGRGRRVIRREIDGVQVTISRDNFVKGFKNAAEFRVFLEALLDETQVNGVRRMDTATRAWDMALWKENITSNAWTVDLSTGEYNFGDPPFADDLMTKIIHTQKKRLQELGLSAVGPDGNVIDPDAGIVYKVKTDQSGRRYVDWTEVVMREKDSADNAIRDPDARRAAVDARYRAYHEYLNGYLQQLKPAQGREHYFNLSHGGVPFSLARGGGLSEAYMQHTKVEMQKRDRSGNPTGGTFVTTLYRRWYDDNINMADEYFPWYQTEVRGPDDASEEVPSGSIAGHNLRIFRASACRTGGKTGGIVLNTPDVGELTSKYWDTGLFRAARKIGVVSPKNELNAMGEPDNPFAWYLAGWIVYGTLRQDIKGEHVEIVDAKKGTGKVVAGTSPYLKGMLGFSHSETLRKVVARRDTAIEKRRPVSAINAMHALQSALESKVISAAEYKWIYDNVIQEEPPVSNVY